MLPEAIGTDACLLEGRWVLDPHLAQMLVSLEAWAHQQFAGEGFRWPGIKIISGHRSQVRQASVNPDAPHSLHTRCPSLAVDLQVGSVPNLPGDALWEWLGGRWKMMGGRWGGDFSPGKGIDGVNRREQNHFDLGVGVSSAPLASG